MKDQRAYDHPAVLAAVDPIHAFAKPLRLDGDILRIGSAISAGLHGTLHAVLAYARMPVTTAVMTASTIRKAEQQTKRAAKSKLKSALSTTDIAASRRYVIASDPVDATVEAAHMSHSDMVIIGAVLRPSLTGLLIGNAAERILDGVNCDVLVMKPPKSIKRVARTANGARPVMRLLADAVVRH